jgi:hypothetical protein
MLAVKPGDSNAFSDSVHNAFAEGFSHGIARSIISNCHSADLPHSAWTRG